MGEYYGLKLSELCKLMKCDNNDRIIEINKLGGVKEICNKLGTSLSQGPRTSLEHRRSTFGNNVIPTKPKRTLFKLLWDAFLNTCCDKIFILLAIECFIPWNFFTIQFEENIMFPFKLLCFIIVILITTIVDFWSERKFQYFLDDKTINREVSVIRNAIATKIVVDDVVVGDVCVIKTKSFVPADGFLIESNDLKIDESSLNGTFGFKKKSSYLDPMVFRGSIINDGFGMIVVTAVGVNTRIGTISTLLENQSYRFFENSKTKDGANVYDHELVSFNNNESMLQMKIRKLFFKITCQYFVVSTILFIVLLIVFIVYATTHSVAVGLVTQKFNYQTFSINFITFLSPAPLGIAIAIQLGTTISLVVTIKKLFKDYILVRCLHSCETMGSVTSICFDKTGTLTTNRMEVVQSYICESKQTWNDRVNSQNIPNTILNLIAENISINSSFKSVVTYNRNNEVVQRGDKTECALLNFVRKISLSNFQAIRDYYTKQQVTHLFPFDSDRKFMSTIIPISDGGYRLFVKGASEVVLSKCKFMFGKHGTLMELSEDASERLLQENIRPMATKSFRTISLAYCDFVTHKTALHETYMHTEPNWKDEVNIVKNLTFLCVLGIDDPIRTDVPKTIKNLQEAGITVRMITGDDIDSATSVAMQCGMLEATGPNVAMDANEFNRRIRDNEGTIQQHLFDKVYPNLRVIARASSMDKYNLVNGIRESYIKESREVCSYVGNGDGDALALKKADAGITFSKSSSEIAKRASNIIIIEDKFDSILKTVLWGRNAYSSICKYAQFTLYVKLFCFIVVFSKYWFYQLIYPKYLLYSDLLLAALALFQAFFMHIPSKNLLFNRTERNANIISKCMIKYVVGQLIYSLVALFTYQYVDYLNVNREQMTYNIFVLTTLFNIFNASNINGEWDVFHYLHSHIHVYSIWIIVFIAHVFTIQYILPQYLHWQTLSFLEWITCFLIGIGIILWQMVLTICFWRQKRLVNPSAI